MTSQTTGIPDTGVPVVLLAHGSRHPDGIGSVDRLAAAVGPAARTAYLDLNQPDLTAAARALAADGHRDAVVVPLLFTPAFHARTDAPSAVQRATEQTGVALRVAPILGTGDDLFPILEQSLERAAIGDGPLLLCSVGSSRPAANATVAHLADRLAARRGTAVHTAFATCDPRVGATLDRHPDIVGVLSLFVGHGLLLDRIGAAAAERGVPATPPLEGALAGIVADRYRSGLEFDA